MRCFKKMDCFQIAEVQIFKSFFTLSTPLYHSRLNSDIAFSGTLSLISLPATVRVDARFFVPALHLVL